MNSNKKKNNHSLPRFSGARTVAVMFKEFMQMRRDRVTFAMMVVIPLMQLILFGYAINTNPKHLPTAVLMGDNSAFTRTFVRGMQQTDYFRVIAQPNSEQAAERLIKENKALFVVSIPPNFTDRLVRGLHPQILLEADATDGVAINSALAALQQLTSQVFNPLLRGNLSDLKAKPPPVKLITHAKYNPENITSYNIVTGLLGVVLTMTLVMVTSAAIVRESERGTVESLLATPVRPLEVMVGKITPYVVVGYIQVALILLLSYYLFSVPMRGSIWLLALAVLPFIAANLSVGIAFSSIAKSQLQAMQMTFFFFLPSILLSGFMFPFYGMPVWAQWIGQVLPLTHFLRITRGILLKGNAFVEIWPDLWPILLFMVVAIIIGVKRYRQTLD